jgi:hypothetical protein
MDIWEIDKLALFLAFVIPGFISIKAYQLAFPGTERATSDQLIDAIAYSSINYALLIFPIISIESGKLQESCRFLYYLFYVFVFFIAPMGISGTPYQFCQSFFGLPPFWGVNILDNLFSN